MIVVMLTSCTIELGGGGGGGGEVPNHCKVPPGFTSAFQLHVK